MFGSKKRKQEEEFRVLQNETKIQLLRNIDQKLGDMEEIKRSLKKIEEYEQLRPEVQKKEKSTKWMENKAIQAEKINSILKSIGGRILDKRKEILGLYLKYDREGKSALAETERIKLEVLDMIIKGEL